MEHSHAQYKFGIFGAKKKTATTSGIFEGNGLIDKNWKYDSVFEVMRIFLQRICMYASDGYCSLL